MILIDKLKKLELNPNIENNQDQNINNLLD